MGRPLPSKEKLIAEFKKAYKINPTEGMLAQYIRHRPVDVHFGTETIATLREKVPADRDMVGRSITKKHKYGRNQ